jgi:hypothetical protein
VMPIAISRQMESVIVQSSFRSSRNSSFQRISRPPALTARPGTDPAAVGA